MKEFYGIISIVISVLLILIIYFIRKIPTMVNDKLKDNRSFQNSHDLQVEAYFRQVGNEETKKLLDDWISLIVKINDDHNAKKITELTQRTILLGSSRTVKIMANMMQFNYKNSQNNQNEDFSFAFMIYIAMIISSLKQDFTGYKIDPLDIIRMKVNDYDKYKDKYIQIYKKLKEWNHYEIY